MAAAEGPEAERFAAAIEDPAAHGPGQRDEDDVVEPQRVAVALPGPAEQSVDRLVGDLAEDIPQRLLDGAELTRALKADPAAVWVALDHVRDPGNLGTILRTADAVGAKGVILVGETTDPFAVEAVRATMGSLFHVPLARMTRAAFQEMAASWPGTLVGTHLKGSTDYRAISYERPTLLLMGNEQAGLPDELADGCDQLARIPQAGRADSLNLAVATGVPVPALSASLAYYDSLRSAVLPSASMIQAQRDCFGGHTYKRRDREGTCTTDWLH